MKFIPSLLLIVAFLGCGSQPESRMPNQEDTEGNALIRNEPANGDDLASIARTGNVMSLFEAVAQKDKAAVKELLKAGADPNEANEEGDAPLHLAIENGDSEIVKHLVDSGADIAARNRDGFSPCFLASIVNRNLALTAILMKTEDNSADAVPYPTVNFGSQIPAPHDFTDTASLIQWNPRFGYRFIASPDWKLAGIQQDGGFSNRSVVVLTLPPIWSETEQQEIRNAFSLFAKEDVGIQSLVNAVADFKQMSPAAKDAKDNSEEGSNPDRVTLDYDQQEGSLTYSKRTVIIYQNRMTYHVEFTATPGTFDKNLPLFSAFCNSIQYQIPEEN